MGGMASQITSLTIVYSTVYSRCRSKKTSKPRVTGLCAGNSPVTGEFLAQRASNVENVSTWWRHHGNERHKQVQSWLVTLLTVIVQFWRHVFSERMLLIFVQVGLLKLSVCFCRVSRGPCSQAKCELITNLMEICVALHVKIYDQTKLLSCSDMWNIVICFDL